MDMTINEVTFYLGKSIWQVRRYVETGLLSAHKVGKQLLFGREQVIEFARTRGLRTNEQVVTGPVDMTPEKALPLAAMIEGFTDAYRRDKLNEVQFVNAVLAIPGQFPLAV